MKSRRSQSHHVSDSWAELHAKEKYSPVYIGPQDGLMKVDKINTLPGQPNGVDFDQYAGYVTIDPQDQDVPLLNMEPWRNWDPSESIVMAKLSLEITMHGTRAISGNSVRIPAALCDFRPPSLVLPSYCSDSVGVKVESEVVGDDGPSSISSSSSSSGSVRGSSDREAMVDDAAHSKGSYDYLWTHGLNSDETHEGIKTFCDFANETSSAKCDSFTGKAFDEIGNIDEYIYAPLCEYPVLKNGSTGSVGGYVVGYEGVTFVAVRGAGHLVPSYQPQKALVMISSFLQGTLLPSS
ncbi:hypothetical protein F0562_022423 [Nyssa sinensis]|uniref:Uncharacterized protein n=1 Tax=Nyssa sinensis TaxID=561372 RepID=A0A5J5BT44_9ASTE|nr:hypothetical protein F0562_022423 [Nyssa sinensis]